MAFQELFSKYNNPVFIEACGASSQLGLSLPFLDKKGVAYLQRNLSTSKASGVTEVELGVAFERMKQGILAAWEQLEEELPGWVPPANKLTFEKLARLLRI